MLGDDEVEEQKQAVRFISYSRIRGRGFGDFTEPADAGLRATAGPRQYVIPNLAKESAPTMNTLLPGVAWIVREAEFALKSPTKMMASPARAGKSAAGPSLNFCPAWFGTVPENFDQVVGDGVAATVTARVHLQRPVVVGEKQLSSAGKNKSRAQSCSGVRLQNKAYKASKRLPVAL